MIPPAPAVVLVKAVQLSLMLCTENNTLQTSLRIDCSHQLNLLNLWNRKLPAFRLLICDPLCGENRKAEGESFFPAKALILMAKKLDFK
jgi:hypothetical protein